MRTSAALSSRSSPPLLTPSGHCSCGAAPTCSRRSRLAQFVFVGRPLLFAAVAAGESGVQRALTLLKDEVDRDMALLRVRSIAEVTPDLVRRLGPEPPFGRNTP